MDPNVNPRRQKMTYRGPRIAQKWSGEVQKWHQGPPPRAQEGIKKATEALETLKESAGYQKHLVSSTWWGQLVEKRVHGGSKIAKKWTRNK